MGYYPIFAEITGRPCIIIGGGSVAERKAEGLLRVKANVTVVSPSLTEVLASLVKQEKIRHIAREYCKGDLAGFGLVFVATDDPGVSAAVYGEGRERGVWVNAADDPAHCDFIVPSVLRRGDLVVAVATGGSSPALSRAIREELEGYFSEDYTTLAEVVAEVRRQLVEKGSSPSAEKWHNALNGDLRRLIREGKQEEARTYLLKQLGAEI